MNIYRRVQAWARSEAAKTGRPTPTAEYLTRHMLESFLDRLTRTRHARDFVLKGGILLASYGVRRPTKDLDAEAISADITPAYLTQVVRDIADVDVDDGVDFDVRTISVQEIREQAEYPGLRLRMKATIGSWVGVAAWDISTGYRGAGVSLRELHAIGACEVPQHKRLSAVFLAGKPRTVMAIGKEPL